MIGFEGDCHVDRAELRATLDDEVARLPEKYRRVVVLCYLDGLTHEQAAERLRCPVGTVRSRLSTAREKLRTRLVRRGVGVACTSIAFGAALSAETARAAVPVALTESTLSVGLAWMTSAGVGTAASGMVSAGAVSLADGVTTTMFFTKLKVLGGVALAGALTLGAGGAAAVQFGGGGAGGLALGVDPQDEPADSSKKKALEDEIRKLEVLNKKLQRELESMRREASTSETKAGQTVRSTTTSSGSGSGASSVSAGGGPGGSSASAGGGPGGSLGGGAAAGGSTIRGTGSAGGKGGRTASSGGGGFGQAGPGGASMGGVATTGGSGPSMMGGGSNPGGMMGMAGMGGGLSMGGFGAMPIHSGLGLVSAGDYVLIQRPDSGKIIASNPDTGDTATYDIPKGTTASMLYGGGVAATFPEGESIREVAAFHAGTGKWYTQEFKAPAEGPLSPIIGNGMVAYTVGNRVYAFSALTKSWDVLAVEGGPLSGANLGNGVIQMSHNDHLYVFNAKTGKWTDHDSGVLVTHKNRLFVFNTKTNAWTSLDAKDEGAGGGASDPLKN